MNVYSDDARNPDVGRRAADGRHSSVLNSIAHNLHACDSLGSAMQFVRFLIVGVINTLVGLGLIYVCMWVLKLDYRFSNFIGYAVGSCVSFVLNRNWTFRANGSWLDGLIRWACVVGGAYLLNLATIIVVHDQFGVRADVSQLAGMVVYTLSSFAGGQLFAFRRREDGLAEISVS